MSAIKQHLNNDFEENNDYSDLDYQYEEFKKETNIDETLYATGFDDAIIGLSTEFEDVPRIVYSKSKMIEVLVDESEMDREEAIEFLSYNTWSAYVGKGTPIYMDDVSKDEIEEILSNY